MQPMTSIIATESTSRSAKLDAPVIWEKSRSYLSEVLRKTSRTFSVHGS